MSNFLKPLLLTTGNDYRLVALKLPVALVISLATLVCGRQVENDFSTVWSCGGFFGVSFFFVVTVMAVRMVAHVGCVSCCVALLSLFSPRFTGKLKYCHSNDFNAGGAFATIFKKCRFQETVLYNKGNYALCNTK